MLGFRSPVLTRLGLFVEHIVFSENSRSDYNFPSTESVVPGPYGKAGVLLQESTYGVPGTGTVRLRSLVAVSWVEEDSGGVPLAGRAEGPPPLLCGCRGLAGVGSRDVSGREDTSVGG